MPRFLNYYDKNGNWDYAVEIDNNSIQNLLERADFDWDSGRIIAKVNEKIVQLTKGDEIITKEFENDYGNKKDCPSFFAEDMSFIYSLSVYDGKYWCSRTPKSLESILSGEFPIPKLDYSEDY